MEKNLIIKRLGMIERLIKSADSRPEFLFLLGMKEALSPLRFLPYFIKEKGGESQNA
ncbi:MAG: hypothetical protein JRJ66_02825 [Deltaproteobacteria bacterium]|nr:hypothetical protein [Deltaproteobacteria bacterium]